jgi:hypothetical protein
VAVQSDTTQPYLRSVPAATWYSAWLSIWVALEGSSPKNWSYVAPADALVQLLPAPALSALKPQVLWRRRHQDGLRLFGQKTAPSPAGLRECHPPVRVGVGVAHDG